MTAALSLSGGPPKAAGHGPEVTAPQGRRGGTGPGPSPARQALKRLLAAALPRRLVLVGGPRGCGSFCLTFDDGPHPEHTPRLLDALALLEVRATFFVVGEAAREHPDLVRRIVAEGHCLGHHSFRHRRPESMSARELMAEVHETVALLREVAGVTTRLFRPPYGKVTVAQLVASWAGRQTVVLWNKDPKDFDTPDATTVLARLAGDGLEAGDLVLMHDCGPHAASLLPDIAGLARGRGLRFATVADWAR